LQLLAEAVVESPDDVRIPADILKLLMRNGRFAEAEKLAYSIPQSLQKNPSISLLMTHLELINASPEDSESSIEAINALYNKQNCEVDLNVRLELASRLLKIDDIKKLTGAVISNQTKRPCVQKQYWPSRDACPI